MRYVVPALGLTEDIPLTNLLRFQTCNFPTICRGDIKHNKREMTALGDGRKQFKDQMSVTSDRNCGTRIYKLVIHHGNYLLTDFKNPQNLGLLDRFAV